jgi:hypothetical protein
MALKQRNDIINMNTALIHAFLDLVPIAFKQLYKQIQMENPNSVSCKMFSWFVMKYGRTSADDRKPNYMLWPWNGIHHRDLSYL